MLHALPPRFAWAQEKLALGTVKPKLYLVILLICAETNSQQLGRAMTSDYRMIRRRKHCNARIQQEAIHFRVILVLFCWLVCYFDMNCQSIVVDLSDEQFHKVQTRDACPAPKKEGFPRPARENYQIQSIEL